MIISKKLFVVFVHTLKLGPVVLQPLENRVPPVLVFYIKETSDTSSETSSFLILDN